MMLLLLLALFVFGGIAVSTASIAVAKTYGVGPYYFAFKQYIFLFVSMVVMVCLTALRPRGVQRVGWIFLVVALAAVALTLVTGVDVKGATRWITVAGQTVQPSEFLKPAFILATASLLSAVDTGARQRGFLLACGLMGGVAFLLLQQPDVGMVMLLGLVWASQVFLSGISILWLAPLSLLGLVLGVGSYITFDHVQSRVARFLNPEGTDTYQVDQAREAILTGHLFGRGAGEGVVKHTLPDAHTDFIFAVLAEEFGIIICLLLLLIYFFIVFRGFYCLMHQDNRFSFIALGGLLTLLALQVMINIAVALHIVPTTGMTLPFISYGGSATLGMAISMGFVLALLRRRQLRL